MKSAQNGRKDAAGAMALAQPAERRFERLAQRSAGVLAAA